MHWCSRVGDKSLLEIALMSRANVRPPITERLDGVYETLAGLKYGRQCPTLGVLWRELAAYYK